MEKYQEIKLAGKPGKESVRVDPGNPAFAYFPFALTPQPGARWVDLFQQVRHRRDRPPAPGAHSEWGGSPAADLIGRIRQTRQRRGRSLATPSYQGEISGAVVTLHCQPEGLQGAVENLEADIAETNQWHQQILEEERNALAEAGRQPAAEREAGPERRVTEAAEEAPDIETAIDESLTRLTLKG